MSGKTQPCIVLTGMHRSATSAAAALLQSAGLHVGERLLDADAGNRFGYFEDSDFVLLHVDALKQRGLSIEGWVGEGTVPLPGALGEKARALVEQRRALGKPWGWKDPRTVLFLDAWLELVPDARYVFMYRAPWDVLDSLFRRRNAGDEAFEADPELAVRVYIHYSRLMLDFLRAHPGNAVVLGADSFMRNPGALLDTLRAKLGIALGAPDRSVVREGGMRSERSPFRAALIGRFFPEAVRVYRELAAAAGERAEPVPEVTGDDAWRKWTLRDWVVSRRLEGELKFVRGTAEKLAAELDASRRDAAEAATRHGRFERLVRGSFFWKLRGRVLRFARTLGFKADLGDDE